MAKLLDNKSDHTYKGFTIKKFLLFALLFSALHAGDYEKGLEAAIHGDFKTALKLWKPLAEKGDPKAQSSYGALFCFGDGMEPDYQECAYWIRKARDNGENVSKIWNDYSLWKYEKKQ